jgi:hypothetical protein
MVVEGNDTDQQEDPKMLQTQTEPFLSGSANKIGIHHFSVSTKKQVQIFFIVRPVVRYLVMSTKRQQLNL